MGTVKRTSWKPGQSGNPRGRPRRGSAISEFLRYELARVTGEDGLTTAGHELARILLDRAREGDVQAIKVVLDRVEGPVPPLVSGAAGGPLTFTFHVAGATTAPDLLPLEEDAY